MVLMRLFAVFSKWNLFLELLWLVGMILVFLEGLLTLSNAYEKVKIYDIIESRKLREM